MRLKEIGVALGIGLSGVLLALYMREPRERVVSIDITRLIHSYQSLLDEKMKKGELEHFIASQEAERFSSALSSALKDYATKNRLIILDKSVVIAGEAKDITDEFIRVIHP